MIGYDKLREAMRNELSLWPHGPAGTRSANASVDEILEVITAAGVPIEDLVNGKKVAVPRDEYNGLVEATNCWLAHTAAPKEPTDG